jgi:hypothetical protein
MCVNTVNLGNMFEAGDSGNKEKDCLVVFSESVGEIAHCDPQIDTGVRRTSIITLFEQNTYCIMCKMFGI